MYRIAIALVCSAFMAVAGDASASIIVPEPLFGASADYVLSETKEAKSTTSSSSSSHERNRNSDPAVPLDLYQVSSILCLATRAGSQGTGSTGSMGGNSSPSSNYVGLVADCTSGFLLDANVVGWLGQSSWLEIPTPPGVSLLRPPQLA